MPSHSALGNTVPPIAFQPEWPTAASRNAIAVLQPTSAGGIPVADAQALETLLTGVRESARSDDDMARKAAKIFDLFYRAYAVRSHSGADVPSRISLPA